MKRLINIRTTLQDLNLALCPLLVSKQQFFLCYADSSQSAIEVGPHVPLQEYFKYISTWLLKEFQGRSWKPNSQSIWQTLV